MRVIPFWLRMVPGGGIEPPTRGFSIRCSTPELPGHSLRRRDGKTLSRRANERALWRSLLRLARGKSGVSCALCLFLPVPVARGDGFGVHRLARNRISIAKPLRQIAVLAALRAKGRKFRDARFSAHRARFHRSTHRCTICACGASSARVGSVSMRTSRPDLRASSSSQSGLSLALSAG